jgi:hypothetical protein
MDLSCTHPTHSSLFSEFFALLPHHWEREGGMLGPCQVWLTLMTMSARGTKGYGRALNEMKVTMGRHFGWDNRRPTPSALSQARAKLTPELCASTFTQILARCTAARSSPRVTFRNRRLVACDGTNLTLPVRKRLRDHFGVPRCSHGDCLAPQAALTVLFDVGAHQPLAFSLERCRYPERRALLALEHHLKPGDLLIADRGYPSRELFARMIDNHRDFLIRAGARHTNSIAEFRAFLAGDKDEGLVTIRRATRGSVTTTIQIRVIRFRDDSVLTTTIGSEEATADELRALYLNRWGIETAFGEMKGFRGLEDFHARTPNGIHQEVTAVFLFMLLESELEGRARQHHLNETPTTTGGTHQATDIRFNRLMMGDWIVYILIAATQGPQALAKRFDEAVNDLWRARMRYKPRRSFPRETKSPNGKWRLKPRVTRSPEGLT